MTKRWKMLIIAIPAGVAIVLTALFFITPHGPTLIVHAPMAPRRAPPTPLPPPIPSTIAVKASLPIAKIRQFVESAPQRLFSQTHQMERWRNYRFHQYATQCPRNDEYK